MKNFLISLLVTIIVYLNLSIENQEYCLSILKEGFHFFIIGSIILFVSYELLPIKVKDSIKELINYFLIKFENYEKTLFQKTKEKSKTDEFLINLINKIPYFKNKNIESIDFFKNIIKSIVYFISFIIIVLWDFVWNLVLKNVLDYIHNLGIYKKIQEVMLKANKWVILSCFISCFFIMEILGLYALILISEGLLATAGIVYVIKILMVFPVKIIYKENTEKLNSINWFNRRRILLTKAITWFEERESYINIKIFIKNKKEIVKLFYIKIKNMIQ